MSELSAAFRRGLRPAVRLPADEWCERNVSLVDGRTPRFSLSQAPWQREPLRALASNRNWEVVLVWPTGCGKSVMFEAWINWIVSQDPGPLICAHQTKEPSQAWVEGRVLPSVRGCGPVKELVGQMKTRRAEGEVVLPHMRLHFGGANKRFLQDHSKRYVLGQEVWDWSPGMVPEIKRRTHDRANRREVYCGQGGAVGSDFEREWDVCEQMVWHYRCPECDALREYEWERVKWDEALAEEDEVDWTALGESVWMECPCGARFEDEDVTRRRLTSSGEYVSRGNKHMPRHVGFTMNALAIWWIPWGRLVQEWIQAKRAELEGDSAKLVAFMNKRLAVFFEAGGDAPEVELGDYSKEEYRPAEGDPAPRWVDESQRLMTVDFQKTHFWVVIRAWRADGASRLLWEGKASTIEVVRDMQRRYEIPNWNVGMDSRYRPEEVARWRWHYAGKDKEGRVDVRDMWVMLMGEDQEKGYPIGVRRAVGGKVETVTVYRPFSQFVKARTAEGIPYQFLKHSNLRIKDRLAGLIASPEIEFGAPSDASKDYQRHMQAEVCRELKGGKRRWEKIKSHYRNDLWDCECMGVVLACIKGLLRYSTED